MTTEKLIKNLIKEFEEIGDGYNICGVIDDKGGIYPLGADTKVLSTIFELISRPLVNRVAKAKWI